MVAEKNNTREGALFACQDELLALFESLSEVIFCAKDRGGRYVVANAAFVRRTGKTSKRDVIGSVSSDHFISHLAERYDDQDRVVFTSGKAMRDELELIRRTSGELGWYLTTKLPVFDNEQSEPIGLVSVSRDLLTPSELSIVMEGLQNVVSHVREHLTEQLKVSDLARVAGCTSDQLTRRMRRVFGVTTAQYVLRVRVEAASEMLLNSTDSIASIAAACGFYDQPSFTHRFARLSNSTPAQFRSNHTKR